MDEQGPKPCQHTEIGSLFQWPFPIPILHSPAQHLELLFSPIIKSLPHAQASQTHPHPHGKEIK